MFNHAVTRLIVTAGCLLICALPVSGITITVDPSQGDTISSALAMASTGDEIQLLDGIYVGSGNRNLVIPSTIDTLIITSDSQPEFCIIDAQEQSPILISQGTQLTLSGIRFLNANGESGSAVFCGGGTLVADHCEFIDSTAGGNGGAVCLLNTSSAEFTNCLFVANQSSQGGAIYMDFTDNTTIGIAHSDKMNQRGLRPSRRNIATILRFVILFYGVTAIHRF